MAFIVRKRARTVTLSRRRQVRPEGSPAGTYTYHTEPVGVLSIDATELPADIQFTAGPLTDSERSALEQKVFAPARQRAAEKVRLEREQREDPLRCIAAARSEIAQAIARSLSRPVESEVIAQLYAAIESIRVTTPADPLQVAIGAVLTATEKVRAGVYGRKPDGTARADTQAAKNWKLLSDAHADLRKALQAFGYVTRAS